MEHELRLGKLASGRPLDDLVRDHMPRPARRRHRPMAPTVSRGRPSPTRGRPLQLERATERVYALGRTLCEGKKINNNNKSKITFPSRQSTPWGLDENMGHALTRIILLKLHDVPPLLDRRFITPGTRAGRMSGSVHTSASALPIVGSDDLHRRGIALNVKVAVGPRPRLEVPLSALPALPGTCSSRTSARMLNGSGSGSRGSRSDRLCRVACVPLLSIVVMVGANGRSMLAGNRLSLHNFQCGVEATGR